MSGSKELPFSLHMLVYPLMIVFAMWLVYWAETRFNMNLNYLGILPQKIEGLRGIIFGPFIHSSLRHLFNNSVPMLVLTTALFYFYRNIPWRILILGTLLTGLLTWSFARPAMHIGASGVVYMLVAFLFFKGILSNHFRLIAFSLVVVFLYGGLFWYLFPIDAKISWEGHLSGFVVGVVFALVFKNNTVTTKLYEWERDDYDPEQDPFLQQFDEDGNFIEKAPSIENEAETEKEAPKFVIRYSIKKNKDASE
ncbi:MAG: rhomboid family intramembrane serine protease [Flavobacteriales bacterium]|jgi:membrane associated rhomboid family serine protease|nr:rhomboid family intramembrane serine protease [Flavobacteriales bacterium]